MSTVLPYVLGFLFDASLDNVVLIRKSKPKWQAGLLNGVGGKVHTGEADLVAMRREFREETGAKIAEWFPFANLAGKDWTVRCYYAVTGNVRVKTTTRETVEVLPVASLIANHDCLDNVPWLVLAARENYWTKGVSIEVAYSEVAA